MKSFFSSPFLVFLFGSAYSRGEIFNDFGIKQEISGDGFTAVYENFYETQIVSLGFKYKF
jgi:hypothetical protein